MRRSEKTSGEMEKASGKIREDKWEDCKRQLKRLERQVERSKGTSGEIEKVSEKIRTERLEPTRGKI